MADIATRAMLRGITLARWLPLARPPNTRLGSLQNGRQLPLVTFAAFLAFSTILAFFTFLAFATLIALFQSWLAPALAFAFPLALRIALAIARDDRLPNSGRRTVQVVASSTMSTITSQMEATDFGYCRECINLLSSIVFAFAWLLINLGRQKREIPSLLGLDHLELKLN